jgi:hypothetical protein
MILRDIHEVLMRLDSKLDTPVRLILCGGGALILAFGSERGTIDLDVIAPIPLDKGLREKAVEIANEMDIANDWLNDDCKGFADYLPKGWKGRLIPIDLGLKNISLFSLGKPDLIMLKLAAGRERDLADVESLGITRDDADIIYRNLPQLSCFDGKAALKVQYFLEESGFNEGSA